LHNILGTVSPLKDIDSPLLLLWSEINDSCSLKYCHIHTNVSLYFMLSASKPDWDLTKQTRLKNQPQYVSSDFNKIFMEEF
jgi:hypothetical protein